METGIFVTLILIVLISLELAIDFKIRTFELIRIGIVTIAIGIFLTIIVFKLINHGNYYPDVFFALIGIIGVVKLVQNYKYHHNFQRK